MLRVTWRCSVGRALRVCPVVLAGGQSRRMGRDKASLLLPSGQTLLQRAQALVASLEDQHGLRFLPPLISAKRDGAIADDVPNRGPLGGLYSVSRSLQQRNTACDALLVIPVDMPLLRRSHLQKLCEEGAGLEANAVCFGSYYFPLWLRLNRHSLEYLREFVEGARDGAVHALMRHLDGHRIQVPPGNWHINVNRPHQFAGLCDTADFC